MSYYYYYNFYYYINFFVRLLFILTVLKTCYTIMGPVENTKRNLSQSSGNICKKVQSKSAKCHKWIADCFGGSEVHQIASGGEESEKTS